MEEENSSLWPWLLGLLVLKVYRNKKNTAHQDLSYFNNDKFEDFDIYWEEE